MVRTIQPGCFPLVPISTNTAPHSMVIETILIKTSVIDEFEVDNESHIKILAIPNPKIETRCHEAHKILTCRAFSKSPP